MKFIYLLGKSASGKDTIYQMLKNDPEYSFQSIILYTTRPMREHEKDGEQYHFISDEEADALRPELIEERVYHTVYGPWRYMTVNDGQFQEGGRYLMIGTLESFRKMADYFGRDCMIPIYLELDDGVRLERAIAREREQSLPKYAEMCRRFLADEQDFSKENLEIAGITRHFINDDREACVKEIKKYLNAVLSE